HQGLAPDAQDAHHLAPGDGAQGDQVGPQHGHVPAVGVGGGVGHAAAPVPTVQATPAVAVAAPAPSPVMRTNSSSSRLDLLRIERTRMPAASSTANTPLRSIARGMSMSSVCASIARTSAPGISG